MDQLPPLPLAPCTGLLLGVGQKPVPPPSPQAKPTALAAARPVGKRQVPGSVALATTGRRVSRPSFCGGERCCRCWCPALLVFSLCGASGHTRRCRQPTVETPSRRGCRARLPTNTREIAGSAPLVAVVRVLAGRSHGGSRRAFPRPKWTGNGPQITYANPRSCGPIFLKYANKSHRVRAGFNR